MSLLRSKALRFYLFGIGCVALGAEATARLHSMLPLALGAATAVMATLGAVRAIRTHARQRH